MARDFGSFLDGDQPFSSVTTTTEPPKPEDADGRGQTWHPAAIDDFLNSDKPARDFLATKPPSGDTIVDEDTGLPMSLNPKPQVVDEDSYAELARKLFVNTQAFSRELAGGQLERTALTQPATDPAYLGLQGFSPDTIAARQAEFADMDEARQHTVLATTGRQIYDAAAKDIENNAPKVAAIGDKRVVYDLANVMVQMVPTIVTALATRNLAAGVDAADATMGSHAVTGLTLGVMGTQVGAQQFGSARAEGQTPEQAEGETALYELAETITEIPFLENLIKSGKGFMPELIKSMGFEAAGESINQVVEQAYEADKQAHKQGIPFRQAWDEQGGWGAVGYAGLLGGLAGGIFHTGAHLIGSNQEHESTLTPEDRSSPVSDDDIDGGRAIIDEALKDYDHGKALEGMGLPGLGQRVNVDFGDGRVKGGEISGAFQVHSPQLGITGQGPSITMDDGTKLEETIETLQRAGVQITPEVAQHILEGDANGVAQGAGPGGVQTERPGNGQQVQGDGQAGEQPPGVGGQGAEAGVGGGVPSAGPEPTGPAAQQEIDPRLRPGYQPPVFNMDPRPAPVDEPPGEAAPIGEPPPQEATQTAPSALPPAGAQTQPGEASSRPAGSTPKAPAPVDVWAADIAKVYREQGEAAAVQRRDELVKEHKITTGTYAVLLDRLRALLPEAANKPKVKIVEVKPKETAAPQEKAPADEDERARFRRELITRGSSRLGKADYSIQLATTGTHYFRKTENGERIEKGPGHPARWSHGQAVQKAFEHAFPDVAEEAPKPAAPPNEHAGHIALASRVAEHLKTGEPLPAKRLFEMGAEVHGGTVAEGKFTPRDAYDSLELGMNKVIRERGKELAADPEKAVSDLSSLVDQLPLQSRRTEETDKRQQFSTPPDYSYVAAWVAHIGKGDTVLEPSAGTGNIMVHALNAGAKVYGNELAPRRAAMLNDLGPEKVFQENAEHLNALLPKDVKPSVVVMNPPFSASATVSGRNTEIGAKHIEQALKRLEPGGRLVAIVGRGMALGRPAFADWWNRIAKEYNVRANISVSGDVYKKFGTTFGTQLLVIDKTGPTKGDTITGEAANTRELLDLVKGVRDERTPVSEQRPGEPGGKSEAGAGESGPNAAAPVHPPTDVVGAGREPGGARPAPGAKSGTDRGGDAEKAGGAGNGVAAVPGGKAPAERETGPAAQPGPAGGSERAPGSAERPAIGEQRVEPAQAGGEPSRLDLETVDGKDTGELTDEVYETYRPARIRVAGAKAHPTELVESAAMASVLPPAVDYKPSLPAKIVKDGLLSDAQLEAVIYAGHAHQDHLPDGQRRGYFIGDGTGVGKGRELSGIIRDNWEQGRKRHIWLSKNHKLLEDAKRDWTALGGDASDFIDLSNTKLGNELTAKQGILFATYDTLKTGTSAKAKEKAAVSGKALRTRLDQLSAWAGPDFDGVLAFDESHLMGNAVAIKGKRGMQKPSARALAGVELQKAVPEARVVYASATGATDIVNLAYAHRLGLWGTGTAFAKVENFVNEISSGGIAAMELVARDMKQLGLYGARNLSYDGVEYDRVEHTLDKNQREIYDSSPRPGRACWRNINAALWRPRAATRTAGPRPQRCPRFGARTSGSSIQIITSMQMPSVIKAVEKDIAAGHSGRAAAHQHQRGEPGARRGEGNEAEEIEDLDITPRDQIIQLVEKSFPTQQYEQYMDGDKVRSRPVLG
jgi:hypothetical protein